MLHKLVLITFALLLVLPTPVLAQDATPVPRANGALLFATDFNDAGGLEAAFDTEWMTYEAGGGVATLASQAPGVVLTAMVAGNSFGDFIAEVDLLPGTAPANTQVGFLFRADGPPDVNVNSYHLYVDEGEDALAMATLVPGGRKEDVINLGSAALSDLPYDATKPNRLRLEAVGDSLIVFLNGQFALQATGGQLASGGFGLAIGSPDDLADGASASAQFANLRIYTPGPAQAPPPETAPPAAPSGEAEPIGIFGAVATARLNVRSGPGVNFGIVGKLKQDDVVFVDARDASCSWLQVVGIEVEGWVSSKYVALMLAECSEVPLAGGGSATIAPVATTSAPAAAATPDLAATEAALPAALVTGFEKFGTWKRGDETWGTFVQSAEQVDAGKYSGKLTYDFPANVPDNKNYVIFRQTLPIAGEPDEMGIAVYGDASGSMVNIWVTDAGGQVWQFPFGVVNHTGWKTMHAPLDTGGKWPVGIVVGDATDMVLDFPIQLRALVLDYPSDDAHAGAIYLDSLTALID